MVHRNPASAVEALKRLWRSIQQNIFSVALVAAGPAVATAGASGADPATIGLVGGQAALAAALAYVHNLIRPGVAMPEAPARAGRTLLQNVVAGALIAGVTAAADVASTGDLATMAWMAAQAVVATLVAYAYNLVRPMPAEDGSGDT